MEFDHRKLRTPRGSNATTQAATPGKRTLTEGLAPMQSLEPAAARKPAPTPVSPPTGPRPTLQMLFGVQGAATAAPAEDPGHVHAAAARGTAGARQRSSSAPRASSTGRAATG